MTPTKYKRRRTPMVTTRVFETDMSKTNLNGAIETFLRQIKVVQEDEDLVKVDLGPLLQWDTGNPDPVHCKFTIQKVKDE